MSHDSRDERNPRVPLPCNGHGRPLTRRDFLGRGLISGAGLLAGPSLLGFLRSPRARAQAWRERSARALNQYRASSSISNKCSPASVPPGAQ